MHCSHCSERWVSVSSKHVSCVEFECPRAQPPKRGHGGRGRERKQRLAGSIWQSTLSGCYPRGRSPLAVLGVWLEKYLWNAVGRQPRTWECLCCATAAGRAACLTCSLRRPATTPPAPGCELWKYFPSPLTLNMTPKTLTFCQFAHVCVFKEKSGQGGS